MFQSKKRSMKRKPTQKEKPRITIYFPQKLYKRFKQQCRAENISYTWYVQKLFQAHLKKLEGG